MLISSRLPAVLPVLISTLALGACNSPDPEDYGGGAEGKAIAKCIVKTERADSAVTRDQAGAFCTCFTEKTLAALESGGMARSSLKRQGVACAKKAGIEVTG